MIPNLQSRKQVEAMPSFPELPGEEIKEIIVMLGKKSLANKNLVRFPVQVLTKRKQSQSL